MEKGFYKKLGEDKERRVNCKIIYATNRNLEKEVDGLRFRKYLFFRISTDAIYIPPLRERQEDIEEISKYYLKRLGFSIKKEQLEILKNQTFLGSRKGKFLKKN